jgi:YbgC/YbaW family acyl-CoA thioester hydrolase
MARWLSNQTERLANSMKTGGEVFKKIKFRGKMENYFLYKVGLPRFNELDSYGVVWNGHFVNYFETARLDLCRHYGFDMKLLSDNGCYLPVYSYSLNIRKPVFARDEMVVAVRPSALEENVMDFSHLLLVNDDIRAYGTVRHVAMSKETGSLFMTLPEHLINILKPLQEFYNENT